MGAITGQQVGQRDLYRTKGGRVQISTVLADDTDPNFRSLRSASATWQQQAREVAPQNHEAARHAYFASDVAFLAAGALANPLEHVMVAQDQGGTIHGITIYRWVPARQVWALDFQTTRPHDQPGYPNVDQVRGVGTLLLQSAAREMAKNHCTTVELETLDEQAARFWRARGFQGTKEPLTMQCPRLQQLADELEGAPADPERGTWVAAGKRDQLEEVRSADAPAY